MQLDLFASATRQPLVVSYGMGVDSTAMLVAMQQRGMVPDLILFSDTGGEKPQTYAYLPVINAWLERHGFPQVTVVRYQPTRAAYHTLEGKCLKNETLPSLAYGGHSCADVFKVRPQHEYLKRWQPAREAWAAGRKVVKLIGYDDSPRDRVRREKADDRCARQAEQNELPARLYECRYPLQEWHIDRQQCEALIRQAGLPVPVKSACFFCPASKKSEILQLRDEHPVLFARALAIEANALAGKHDHRSVKGLGRGFAWAALATASTVDDDEEELLRP